MPRFIAPALAILLAIGLIPLVFAAKARVSTSTRPRVHLVPDMDQTEGFKSQQANRVFRDGRAMRPYVPGTVARGELFEDDHLFRGKVGPDWAKELPDSLPLSRELLDRGRARYDIFCATCHGLTGNGRGPTTIRAEAPEVMEQGTWTPPTPYDNEQVRNRAVGHIYNTITNGIRNMPAYAPQIPVEDRWAIVAYVRALMRSQDARIEDVPTDVRSRLR
jgi:mono/diheme cytochrome c family protein